MKLNQVPFGRKQVDLTENEFAACGMPEASLIAFSAGILPMVASTIVIRLL
ncbi:hypothetical protein [Sporolactobacillus pectinivorans]|uniref:hypothetical protein n=1 Tax=Sporolactobacillus pectinivorans TaxID=1591408 RepID=UPI0012FD292D|nr:hypothetical protein [Sporolactobacillus pectinivorans]